MLRHAYVIEMVQLLAAIAGLGFNIWCVRQANRNITRLAARHLNGLRMMLANEDVQQEWLRLLQQILLVLYGVISVAYPPPSPDVPMALEWGLRLTRIIIIHQTILLTIKSWLDVRNRRGMIRAWMTDANRREEQTEITFPDRREH